MRHIRALSPETGAEWPGHWPRPSRLLARPEPIETIALLPDHPPVSFTWRGVRRRVTRADGPERVFGEWWKRDPELEAVRDYFRVEDDAGERYWVFRAGDGEDPLTGSQRWFLHGNLRMICSRYAELQVTSYFSFLRGASSCEELFATAAALGIEALGIVDRNSLAGVVRAHEAAKTTGVRLVVGCRLDLSENTSVLVYPTDRPAYARLCRLLSLGKKRAGKGKCDLAWADLVAYGEGLIAGLTADAADEDCALRLWRLREAFNDRAYMALSLRRRPNDQLRLFELSNLATSMRVRTVVTNDVLFHEPGHRILQDVVTCIRHNVTIDELGDRRERHADRYIKPPDEVQRLFARYPEALACTVEIVDRCRFSLDELAHQYPEERADPSLTPGHGSLENLTWEKVPPGAIPRGLPDDVVQTLRHELRLIEKLDYAPYFLTVHSIVRFARSKDILCQGRGTAANSAVCYAPGITSIDPARNDLLFERIRMGGTPRTADIDVDFEHEQREIVMQWIFEQYGRDHAAVCSTVIRYRTKGAIPGRR